MAFAELGGWDTHINQGAAQGQLAARLDDFARAIAALTTDLGDRMEDTVVVTMSEFGRAVSENGNRGTDHGHGNAMLVMGGGVRGGRVLGQWPGLAVPQRFEGRDLAVTTDFRDVFAEIVVRHLGVGDAKPIFPGYDVQESRFPGLFALNSRVECCHEQRAARRNARRGAGITKGCYVSRLSARSSAPARAALGADFADSSASG